MVKKTHYELQPIFIAQCQERYEHAFPKTRGTFCQETLSAELKSLLQTMLVLINMKCSFRKCVAVDFSLLLFSALTPTPSFYFAVASLYLCFTIYQMAITIVHSEDPF